MDTKAIFGFILMVAAVVAGLFLYFKITAYAATKKE